uniref:Uncharacterized protein n=1 Tax=Romanomermis culicivorax TaxID=13658 RepID=A0A915L187_ROMCU
MADAVKPSKITSSMFLVKDIAWIHVLTYGQSPDGLESFVDSMMAKSTNDTGVLVHLKPIYVSLSSFNVSERHLEYTRRYIASYALHAIWSGCGILASLALCASVLNNKSLFVLPWLTWSAVNVVIIAVNGVVDIVMWSHFRIYNSLNWFALFIYSSVPFMVYLILIVTRYYAIIEADISEDEIYRDNMQIVKV